MKYSKIYLALLAAGTLTQQSCLKDNPGNSSPKAGTNNVVQFFNTTIPTYNTVWPQYDNGITVKNDTGSFVINVNWAGTEYKAPNDITVTLALDQTALDDFNNDAGTDFITLPDGSYTATTTAVIAKGTNYAQIRVVVTTIPGWDYSQTYALPLHIVSASSGTVSSNFGTAVYTVVANNEFAGKYTSTGFLFHPSSPRAIDADYAVTTTGLTENRFPFGDLGASNYYFAVSTPSSTGAVTGYRAIGACPPAPASGLMTLDNPANVDYSAAAPENAGAGEWTKDKYNNTHDYDAKTYWFHLGYQTGSTGQSGYTRQLYMKMVKD